MALVESTLSSALKKHEANPYIQESKPHFTFYLQLPDRQNLLKTQLQLQPMTLVSDALLFAIEDFNDQLEGEGKQLIKNIEYYIPRLTKKNGKAKTDMPCLDINQKLIDLKLNSIAIQIKEFERAFVSKKVDHEEFTKKKSETKSTIIVEMTEKSVKSSNNQKEQIEEQPEKQSSCFCSFC